MHVDYILAAANLRAESYGLEQIRDRDYIVKELEKIRVAPFKPKEGERDMYLVIFSTNWEKRKNIPCL